MSTPSASVPSCREQERFEELGAPCEWAELYCPGGYHPVHLGDTFADGRYRVIRKLGDGSYATVWLAVDNIESRYVALKIMMAKKSGDSANTELEIYKRLATMAPDDASLKHIMMPLDTFEHDGPNGKHRCLIYQPMASTATSMVEKLPWNPPNRFPPPRLRYPKWMAKRILKHALSGLALLHKNGVVHGDFQPGNLLFSMREDLNSISEDELQQDKVNITQPLRRLDGKPDKWAPQYLMISQSLHTYADLGPDLVIRISDLGAAFWSNHPPASTVTPLALRAPELIFNESFDSSIDIWSFGCLIYEFLTGVPLFSVFSMGDHEKDDADDDHLLDLNDVIEPLPDSWLSKWPRSHKYFGPNRERLMPESEELSDMDENFSFDAADGDSMNQGEKSEDETSQHSENSAVYMDNSKGEEEGYDTAFDDDISVFDVGTVNDKPMITNDSLEVLFDKNKPRDIDSDEAKVITELIRKILRFEPSERPTAAELLQHEWFKD